MSGRRFGFECELSSGAGAVISALHEDGLAGMNYLHDYHCSCGHCDYNDVEMHGGYLFRGQEDCTVDGEIISSILTHGGDSAERAFTSLSKTLLMTRAGVATNAGFHVHVNKEDFDNADHLRLYRMFLRYQFDGISELGAAKESNVREYNHPLNEEMFERHRNRSSGFYYRDLYLTPSYRPRPYEMCNGRLPGPDVPICCSYCRSDIANGRVELYLEAQAEWDRAFGPGGNRPIPPAPTFWDSDDFVPSYHPDKTNWLHGARQNTFEFRLWNSTRVEWRMRLAVGVSVAMVDAAKAGVNVKKNDPRPFEEVIGDFLSDDAWAGIIRQRSFKEA